MSNGSSLDTISELIDEVGQLKEKTIKKVSIALGIAGQNILAAGYWGYISRETLVLTSILFGLGHFYFMEIDYKWVLQVRPYAYLPFGLALLVLGIFLMNIMR